MPKDSDIIRSSCNMIKTVNIVVLTVILITMFIGISNSCYSATKPLKKAPPPPIAIKAKVGQTFVITIPSNPTTGYSWKLERPLKGTLVSLVRSEYIPPKTKMVGKGGKEIWTFRALNKGTAIISLMYVRPWETGIKPVKINTYIIEIK